MTPSAFVPPLIEATASTLVHFVWEGAVIALLLGAALRLLRGRSAAVRYAVSVFALLAAAAAAGVTFALVWPGLAPLPSPNATAGAFAAELGALDTLDAVDPTGAVEWIASLSSEEPLREAVLDFAPAVVAFWFAGVLLCSLRLAIGFGRVMRLVRQATFRSSEWTRALARLSRRITLPSPVRLLHSVHVDVPTVVGVLRPVILVPLTSLTGLTPSQIETILAHELAHIRRHDFLVNLVQSAIETLLFYHPAVWWISRQVRIEREHCCDDLAVELCGDRLLYARALAELEQLRAVAQPSLAATGGALLGRIRRLVLGDDARHVHTGWVALAVLSVVAAAAVAAPLSGRTGEDAIVHPGGALFWPADARIAHIAAAIAASTPIPSLPIGDDPGAVVLEHDAAILDGVDGGIDDAIDGGIDGGIDDAIDDGVDGGIDDAIDDGVDGAISSWVVSTVPVTGVHRFDSGFAYRVARAVGGGETVTVREPREEDEPRVVVDGLTVEDLIRLRSVGVSAEYIRGMREVGYDLPLARLESLRAVGVIPEYVRSLQSSGYGGLDAEDLQALRAVGVSAEFIAELGNLGIHDLEPEDLISLRAVGVTPAYISEMRSLFGAELDPDEIVQMRAVGVSAEFAASMRAAGYDELDPERLIELRGVGVNADYIAALRAAGYPSAELDEIVAARAVGVSTRYLEEMAAFGIRELDLDEVISLRAVGVTPEWIRQMAEAGYPDLDADEMQQLRALGVTPAYVRDLREAGVDDLDVDDLIQLRSSGVDAAFIRRMREARKH